MILSPRFEKSTFFLRKSNILRELIWGERFYFFFYREVEVSKGGLDKLNAPFPVCYQFNPWQDHHNVIGSGHSHCLSLPLQHIKIKYIGHIKKHVKKLLRQFPSVNSGLDSSTECWLTGEHFNERGPEDHDFGQLLFCDHGFSLLLGYSPTLAHTDWQNQAYQLSAPHLQAPGTCQWTIMK